MEDSRNNTEWLFIDLYGELEAGKHHITWELLQGLKLTDIIPWLVMGDFNKILYSFEKMGGWNRSEKQMQEFREALVSYNLIDLGHRGDFFTWSNNHEEHLDRAVPNPQWMQIYVMYNVEGLGARSSNHKPIYLSFHSHSQRQRSEVFRYVPSWYLEEDFSQQVEQLWNEAPINNNVVPHIQQKLSNCTKGLKMWGANKNRGNTLAITDLSVKLKSLQTN